MLGYLRQIRFYCLALVVYVVLNAVIWNLFTGQFTDPTNYVGELARLSYLSQYAQPRHEVNALPKRHISYDDWDGENIDLITIGDSFSSGGGGGPNAYYQDWLATRHNLRVMNLPKLSNFSNIETAYILLHSGFLEELSPTALLLEDVARQIVKIHGRDIRSHEPWLIHQVKATYSSERNKQLASNSAPDPGSVERLLNALYASKPNTQFRSYSFLNSGNMKFLLNQVLYAFDDNAISSKVYRTPLKQSFFSKDSGTTLLFYFEDIESISWVDDSSIALVAQNFNDLATELAKSGIALYFMPAVDKFDLYCDQILDPRYPRNPFFDKLRKHPRAYQLVDTQAILAPAIAEGEEDVFFVDDTHWTWKACKRISEAFVFPPQPDNQAQPPLSSAPATGLLVR